MEEANDQARAAERIRMTEARMHLPTRFGDPCWTPDAADRALSSIARMSPALEPYFVATHAPMHRLHDDKRGGKLAEDKLFERLFHSERGNVFAILHGDPGTGKSHLIRWLH